MRALARTLRTAFHSLILSLIVFSIFGLQASLAKSSPYEQSIALVIEATDPKYIEESNSFEQLAEIQLDNGKTIVVKNFVPNNQAYKIIAKEGRKYVITNDDLTGETYISDYYREPAIFILLGIFTILVISIGSWVGVKAILCLLCIGFAIFKFLIPGIQAGYNPLLLGIILSIFATALTMISIAGFSRKSLAATIGTVGGVLVSGIIASLVIEFAPLSGIASEEAFILLANLPANQELNFQGILSTGVLIASLGAAVDVAVSIASAAQEICEANPNLNKRRLFTHTMKIGKDIMSTMVDTLILVYTGASLPLLLLLASENGLRYLNMEIIATELVSAISGSIGLILAIPITAAASVFLLKKDSLDLEASSL